MDLKGATVVVTGGARRVGRHVATRLAERGANIVVNYRTSAKEARGAVEDFTALGVGALAVQADVSTQAGVERIRDAAIERFGGVDVLLNNASIYAETPLDDLTEADFDRNIAVNLKGPYLGCWLFGLHMRERGRGKIVNIADWAVNRPYVNYAPYFVAKGGIVTLTRVFAKELAPSVMVNAIAPGRSSCPPTSARTPLTPSPAPLRWSALATRKTLPVPCSTLWKAPTLSPVPSSPSTAAVRSPDRSDPRHVRNRQTH